MDTKTQKPFEGTKTTFTPETFLALPDHVRDCYPSFEKVKAITVCDVTGWFYEHTPQGRFTTIIERGEYETSTAEAMEALLRAEYYE